MSCRVHNCRYSQYHTTSGHKCGKCGEFGHGQLECGNIVKIYNLKPYLKEKIADAKQCSVMGCKFKCNHTNKSHYCDKCDNIHSHDCIIQDLDTHIERFDMLRTFNINLLDSHNNVYVQSYVGMGCYVYIRKKNNILQSLFMHSDSWGQYGEDTNDQPILLRFIENLTEVSIDSLNQSVNHSIMCPLCRTNNSKDEILDIKGSGEKCVCCMTNNIEIYLAKCKHACLCKTCLEEIKRV